MRRLTSKSRPCHVFGGLGRGLGPGEPPIEWYQPLSSLETSSFTYKPWWASLVGWNAKQQFPWLFPMAFWLFRQARSTRWVGFLAQSDAEDHIYHWDSLLICSDHFFLGGFTLWWFYSDITGKWLVNAIFCCDSMGYEWMIPSGYLTVHHGKWPIEIDGLPINSMVIFHRYVK